MRGTEHPNVIVIPLTMLNFPIPDNIQSQKSTETSNNGCFITPKAVIHDVPLMNL